MKLVRPILPLLLALLLSHLSLAQQTTSPQSVSESVARQHLTEYPDPIYPPIAKAAGVHGDVILQIVINAMGAVIAEKVISGPAMLQQAALNIVKDWRFTPFQSGDSAVQTTTFLTIPFQIVKSGEGPTAEQEKAAQAWFPLEDKCRTALKAQNKQEAVDACKQALDMSFKAGDVTNSDKLGRLDSHQLYGHALISAGNASDALEQENLAIEEAKKCLTDTDEEYGMPFFWRAIVEANLGHADAALADFQTAEETHRKAIIHLPDMKNTYSKYLASILRTHAALLDRLGRSPEAEKLKAEAASL